MNHPLIDGNKRTACVLIRLILLENGYDIIASADEKYNLVVRVASGKLHAGDIVHESNYYQSKIALLLILVFCLYF